MGKEATAVNCGAVVELSSALTHMQDLCDSSLLSETTLARGLD